MYNADFYKIIDQEIDKLNIKFKHNPFLQKQDPKGKKSFGFLLWFLKTYLPNENLDNIEKYITEGEGDHSCDLIFSNLNNLGEDVFYVIQAKWFTIKNISSNNKMTKEIKACLTDFRLILSGKKTLSTRNINFEKRYEEFLKHKKNNGKIKFLFVALCIGPKDIKEYRDDFVTKLVSFELFDIILLKKHYLELEYKEIKTHNPIEEPYEPKGDIILNIVPLKSIESIESMPYKSYIFLVKPALIYDLFDKYQFGLFYKNIRNPLPKSIYNQKIADTIKNNPLHFWYFNNGITAITDKIDDFHKDSENVTVKGLQIINGAQTVFSIYEAYRNATEAERRKINSTALITLRISESGGRDFDLDVTRFTNSQNPIRERDFRANDEIQKRLQSDFLFNTNIWYEIRRGEFRKVAKSVKIIPNEILAQTYLSYYLEEPLLAKSNKSLIFISNKNNAEGLYEKIFNNNIKYSDMLVSYYIFVYVEHKRKEVRKKISKIMEKLSNERTEEEKKFFMEYNFLQYASFDIVALFKYLLYIVNKNNIKGINGKIIYDCEKNNHVKVSIYYGYIVNRLSKYIENNEDLVLSVYFKKKSTYLELKNCLQIKPYDIKEMQL